MSRLSRARNYRDVLGDRRLARTFALAMVGRFGYATLPLCVLFTIAQSAHSFVTAASSLAAFGVSALVMPVQSRQLDRHGHRRVLPIVGTGFSAALVVIAVMGARGVHHAGAWLVTCVAAGLVAPSLGPSMRAQWRVATTGDRRSAGYSLDAVAEEVVFFLGPVAASVVLALGPAWRGVALVALLIPVGVVGLVRSPFTPEPRRPRPLGSEPGPGVRDRLGPLRAAPFRRLLVVMALAGVATSSAATAVAALADRAHQPSATGIVEAAAGVMSVVGGLWWGSRPTSDRWRRDLAALTAARVPLLLGCALAPGLWSAGAFVALGGLVVSPLYVVGYTASDRVTVPHQHTEASTWVTSVNNVGMSTGTALTGWAFTRTSTSVVFGLLAAVLVVAVLTSLVELPPGPSAAPERP